MPVPSRHFYSREDETESDKSSECRWPPPHFVSDYEVPPTDVSEPLSAPESGFSLPKTTSSGVHPPCKRRLMTRFAKSVVQQQDRWQTFSATAQEVLAAVHNPTKQPLDLNNSTLGPPVQAEAKCASWIDSLQAEHSKENVEQNKPTPNIIQQTSRTLPSAKVPGRRSLGMSNRLTIQINKPREPVTTSLKASKRKSTDDFKENYTSTSPLDSTSTSPASKAKRNSCDTTCRASSSRAKSSVCEARANETQNLCTASTTPPAAPIKAVKGRSCDAPKETRVCNNAAKPLSPIPDARLTTPTTQSTQKKCLDKSSTSNATSGVPKVRSSSLHPSRAVSIPSPAPSVSKGVKSSQMSTAGTPKSCQKSREKYTPIGTQKKCLDKSSTSNATSGVPKVRSSSLHPSRAVSIPSPAPSVSKGVKSSQMSTAGTPKSCQKSREKSTPIGPKQLPQRHFRNVAQQRLQDQQEDSTDDGDFSGSDLDGSWKATSDRSDNSQESPPSSPQSQDSLFLVTSPLDSTSTSPASKAKRNSCDTTCRASSSRAKSSVCEARANETQNLCTASTTPPAAPIKAAKGRSCDAPKETHVCNNAAKPLSPIPDARLTTPTTQSTQKKCLDKSSTSNATSGVPKVRSSSLHPSRAVSIPSPAPSVSKGVKSSQMTAPSNSYNSEESSPHAQQQGTDLFLDGDVQEEVNDQLSETEQDMFLDEDVHEEEPDGPSDGEHDLFSEDDFNNNNTIDELDGEDEDSDNCGDTNNGGAPIKITKSVARSKRKELRNLGQAYTTGKGVCIEARKWKPPHTCKVRKCQEVITPEIGNVLFEEYWQQGSHDKRVAYVAARIETCDVNRRRSREDKPEREKGKSLKYFFDIDGARVQVCRSTFIDTLGETDRFVRTVTENKQNSRSGISQDDRRGKHTPQHSLDEDRRKAVRQHIDSFPAYVSHYCRAKAQSLYLASDLNVTKMYNLYREDEPNPVSYNTYLKEFNKTKKKFHPPKSDGCDTCDKLDISIAGAGNDEAKNSLKADKERHLRKAEKAYELKREAKARAIRSKGTELLLMMDLQQCLPTPFLKCKKIYYSRQLYVFNFTIQDTVTEKTYCYMWDEVEGKRGSNEMASCLLIHTLNHVPVGVKKLTIVSDCCSGQNRNHVMCMMLNIALQEHPTLELIDHIFLLPGHTFMPEVDGKHAVIDNYKRRCLTRIDVPGGWYTAVEAAGGKQPGKEGKYSVIRMLEFYDFAALAKSPLIKRDKCLDKSPFKYMETQWFQYQKDSIGIVNVRSSYSGEFRVLSFLRRGVRSDRVPSLLPLLTTYRGPFPISSQKKKDLMELLPYLSEEHHSFYRNLPDSSEVPEVGPDLVIRLRVAECCQPENAENAENDD